MVISGARKGIGRFLCEHYLASGWRVIGCSRNDSDLQHPNYCHVQLDISDESAVTRMMLGIGTSHGRLDALLNNAGVASMNHFLLTPGKTAQKLMQTNYLGTFLLSREAARLMRAHKSGRIINFSSVAAPLNLEGEAAYAASKAAVGKLTEVLARELAAFNITVNAVGPGPIATDLIRNVPKGKIEQLLARQPFRIMSQLADVSNVTDFFLKSESDCITGQTIFLGGVS